MPDPVMQTINNARKPKNGTRKIDLTQELLLGSIASNSFYSFLGQYLKSLPQYIDDAQRDFGLDIYDRMINDSTISAAINIIRVDVLASGPRFLSRVTSPTIWNQDIAQQTKYEEAEEIKSFVERMMDRLQQPLEDILWEMMDFLPFGYSVAEETYEVENGKLILKTLRVKPRRAYGFVVDQSMNLCGLIAAKAGQTMLSTSGLGAIGESDIIPREKFFILSHASRGADPRGTSILRPAYNPWYLKQQVWPMYLKYLAQFGTPSIWAELPPDASDVETVDAVGNLTLDDSGNPVVKTAAEALLEKLIAFANGTAIALENGSSLNIIEQKGNGLAYVKAIELFDQQITRAILLATRATMEAQYGSKADSSTAQDILGEVIQHIRRKVEIAFYRDVILPIVRYNFGDEIADSDLVPYMSLADIARENVAETGNMIANLARAGVIHSSQYQGIDSSLGLPERDMNAQLQQEEADRERKADLSAMLDLKLPSDGSGSDTGE